MPILLPGFKKDRFVDLPIVAVPSLARISVPGEPHPDGRPIGVQIVAPFGHDAVALEIGRRLEALAPWSDW